MIALIDYGAGNLTSVRKALAALDAEVEIPGGPSDLEEAFGVIVPGVGNFRATAALTREWRDAIIGVVERGRPLLGICLGLQWLFEGSTEAPDCQGLSIMSGRCDRLKGGLESGNGRHSHPSTGHPNAGAALGTPAGAALGTPRWPVKVPHVGWNALEFPRRSRLFEGICEGSQVYFTHSYAAPVSNDTTAVTVHGAPFASGVERGHIFGVQFHPEKSGEVGLRVLKNFLDAL